MSRTFRLLVMALIAALALGIAACGDDDDDGGGGGDSTEEQQGEDIKAGLVTDIGGLNDRWFNEAANKGRERAQSELGIETRVLVSEPNGDYVPNLTTLAQQQYDMIVSDGFLMARRHGHRRVRVAGHQLRDHRLLRLGLEGQAEERARG